MPRLHFVKSARPSAKPRTCRKCSAKIKVGDSYYWFANRMGRMSVRKDYCSAHRPKASDMTTSDKLATLYGAQEAVEATLADRPDWREWSSYRDDVVQALRDAAQSASEAKDGYQESFDNLPENFQNASTGQDIQEKIDACEEWESELESAADDIEGMEPDAAGEEDAEEEKKEDAEEGEEPEEEKKEESGEEKKDAEKAERTEDGFTEEDIDQFYSDVESRASDAVSSLSL